MAGAIKFTIRQFVLGPSTFVPITAPIDCNYWKLTASNQMQIATDLTDPTHQETIANNGTVGVFGTPVFTPTILCHRFETGSTLVYARGVNGTVTATLEVVL